MEQASSLGSVTVVLQDRILLRQAGVRSLMHGMYVGLQLVVENAKVGFQVVCMEYQAGQMINEGQNYTQDVNDGELARLVKEGLITVVTSFEVLDEADVIIICEATRITENSYITNIVSVIRLVAEHLHSEGNGPAGHYPAPFN